MIASTAQPMRLPIHEAVQQESMSESLTLPRKTSNGMNMVCPVKRSEPAKMTSVSATPKDTPMMSGR